MRAILPDPMSARPNHSSSRTCSSFPSAILCISYHALAVEDVHFIVGVWGPMDLDAESDACRLNLLSNNVFRGPCIAPHSSSNSQSLHDEMHARLRHTERVH